MHGVIAGGPGAIAWGEAYATGPRIWYTSDGLDWEQASVEAATDADPDMFNAGAVLDLTAGGPGFVAVGVYFRAGGDGNTSMVWTSGDGITWRRVPPDPVFARSRMDTVVAWHGELFAYGCKNVSATDCGEQRVWSSSDGLSWEVVELTLPDGMTDVTGVTVLNDRLLGRAITWSDDGFAGDPIPQVGVASTDGRTWTVTSLPLVGRALYPSGDVLYAFVHPGAKEAVGVYRSTDLAAWTLVSEGLTNVGNDLIAVNETLVMVGHSGNCVELDATCVALGWRSTDGGRTWTEGPVTDTPPVGVTRAWMDAVAALPNGTLIAVGKELAGGEPSTAAWVSPPEPGT